MVPCLFSRLIHEVHSVNRLSNTQVVFQNFLIGCQVNVRCISVCIGVPATQLWSTQALPLRDGHNSVCCSDLKMVIMCHCFKALKNVVFSPFGGPVIISSKEKITER